MYNTRALLKKESDMSQEGLLLSGYIAGVCSLSPMVVGSV